MKNSVLWAVMALAAGAAACAAAPDHFQDDGASSAGGSGGSASSHSSGGGPTGNAAGNAAGPGGMAATVGGTSSFGGSKAFAGSVGLGGGGAFGGPAGGSVGTFGGTSPGGAAGGFTSSGGMFSAAGTGGAAVSVCTSKKTWTGGNGTDMRPGNDCKSCHSNFFIAGTVYPTLNEPNNCDGTGAAGLKVLITGANGTTLTLTPSATSGNFYSTTKISTPYSVKITNSAGASRSMVAHQTAGNCNSCHIPTGANGAPGRIMAP